MDRHLSRPEEAPRADDPLTEVLLGWAIAAGLVYVAWRLAPAPAAPFAATAAWIAVPLALHVRAGRSLEVEGIAIRAPLRSLKLVAIYAAVFLPLYALGWFAIFGRTGWEAPSFELPVVAFAGHLFHAALPEEVFFRGFVQPRLASPGGFTPEIRRVLGVPLSRPIALTAALFAFTHVAFLPDPLSLAAVERLTTFFPGLLFGALREETGDVLAPALFHAACNALLYTLQHGFLT